MQVDGWTVEYRPLHAREFASSLQGVVVTSRSSSFTSLTDQAMTREPK